MFVKVDANDGDATLFQIPPSPNGLEFGSEVTYEEPWKVDWTVRLGVAFSFLNYRGNNTIPAYQPPTGAADAEKPYWIVHWAWWSDPDKGTYGVVTTYPLYILNDNGRTIDSLRHGSGNRKVQ